MTLTSRLELEVDSGGAEQKVIDMRKALDALDQAGLRIYNTFNKSGSEFTNLALSLSKAQAANDKAAQSSDRFVKSSEDQAKAAANQRKELDSLLGKIDPLTKKLNELAAQETALAKARDSGQINTSAYDAYNKKIQDSLNALTGAKAAQEQMGESAEQAKARILALAQAATDSAQAQRNLANTATGLSEAEQGLISSTAGVVAGQGRLASSSDKTAAAVKQAGLAASSQATSLDDLLASIDPTTKALNRLDEQERQLARQKKLGAIDSETFTKYQTVIDNTRTSLSRFDDGMTRTGNTAKQTAAALRGVPAQFTDIFVSLQGGQAPLTVFLQQGGQLKDMFGGVAPAAKALGGYILGLINPFTVAAAAVGALGVAYYQGSKEADAYRLALVTTGNAAGTTTGALAEMATRVSSTVGTTAEAASALAQLAASGNIASENFTQIATAAIAFEKATGKAVSDTVAEFVRLQDDPVKALAALNDKYNFLTASVYEQVRALQEQGDKQGAAAIAEDAYARALQARAGTMKANLGTLERAWSDLAGAAKNGWDAILNIGRESSDGPNITAIQQKINYLKSTLDTGYEDGNARQRIATLQAELDLYAKRSKAEQDSADAAARAARVQREGQVAYEEYQKSVEQNFSKTQKMNKALEDEQKRITAARAAGYTITAEQEEAAYKAIRDNTIYKEAAAKREKAYREDAGIKALDQAKQQYAVLQQQSALIGAQKGEVDKVGVAQQALIKWEQELSDIKEKKTLTADQKSLLANQELITAQLKRNAALERTNALRKIENDETEKLVAFQQAVNDKLSLSQQDLSNQLAGIGLGSEGRKRLQDDLKIRQDYQKEMDKLQEQLNKNEISPGLYDKETAALKSALAERLDMQQDYYRKLDAAQADWTNGAVAALQDYSTDAANISNQTYNLITDGLHGIEDGFANLATKGKFSFRDLADSIIADLARIAAKTLIVQPLIAALFGGSAGGGSTAGSIVGSLLSGGGGSDTSSGGLTGSIKSLGSTVYKLYSAVTGVGSSIASGYASGGLSGALSGGYSYYSNMFSGLANTLSTGFSGITSAIFGQTAAQAATSAALQTSLTQGVASVGTNLGLGGFAAEGAAAGAGAAATGVGSGLYAQLAAMASNPVGWAIAAVTAAYQSGRLYDKGVRPDASAMWESAGSTALGKVALTPQTLGSKYFEVVDGIVGKVVGGKLAAMLSGSTLFQAVWSGVGTKLFGSGWQTKDQGIQLGVTNGDLQAYQYQDQKKKGGLISGSSKKRTKLSPLDAEMQAEVQDAFDSRLDTVFSIFDTLNVDVPEAALDGLNMDAWKISLKDLTTDQANQLFSDFFEVLGNEAVGTISKSMNLGLDTYNVNQLTEFAGNLLSINDTFKLLNINALPVSVWGGKLAEQYVAMAGGLEALNTASQTYYSAFFTDAEKNADTLEAVKKQFADLNIAFPSSREGFRALVEGIDSTTDAGRTLFLQLMGLAGNASTAYDILTQKAQAANQALLDGANNGFSALQRSIDAQKASINDMLTTANQSVSDLTSIATSLDNALKGLRGTSADAVTMLRSQAIATLQSALATAKAGKSLAGFDGLTDALDVVGSNNTGLYSSLEDFNRDQGRAAALIDELNTLNGKQLTNAEKTVEALEDQLDRLDDQLAVAQAQLDALNGVDNSILGVTDAVNAMNAAVVAALAAIGGKATEGTAANNGTLINSVYQKVLGRNADASGLAYWQQQLSSGAITYAQLEQAIRNAAKANGSIPAFANGGSFGGGIRLVGERGPEIELTGPSRIISNRDAAKALNGGAGDGWQAVVDAIEVLKQYAYQTTKNTGNTAAFLRQQNEAGVMIQGATA